MDDLRKKEIEVQIAKVSAAMIELEYALLKKKKDCERLEKEIELSQNKIKELKSHLGG